MSIRGLGGLEKYMVVFHSGSHTFYQLKDIFLLHTCRSSRYQHSAANTYTFYFQFTLYDVNVTTTYKHSISSDINTFLWISEQHPHFAQSFVSYLPPCRELDLPQTIRTLIPLPTTQAH